MAGSTSNEGNDPSSGVSDASAIVALGRAIDREQLATEGSFRALLERPAEPTTERIVAELDGRVVAWAPSGAYESRDGWFWIGGERSERGQGLGSLLYERIETRVRALHGDGRGRVVWEADVTG